MAPNANPPKMVFRFGCRMLRRIRPCKMPSCRRIGRKNGTSIPIAECGFGLGFPPRAAAAPPERVSDAKSSSIDEAAPGEAVPDEAPFFSDAASERDAPLAVDIDGSGTDASSR
eukprot:CAMPEP_0119321664 /NCGR_PEP_ID=MMETSP1333-20130426/56056_1 /TAXON_ID=418940 /ORGANISM="Scyphosphaera apsteinii, Strain RCC1455" /LENGTH=113 /DNA_ID=CAMNT_0007328679 /DNA_START=13 /DNA_END=354 /DNA_ORIENTATION=+